MRTPTGDQGGGNVDPAQSTISLAATTVASGSAVTATLQLKNSAGQNLTTGTGVTVVPTKSGGTATGTLSSVTDHGDGTFTWTYTGVLAGTAQTLGATLNGVSVSSTLPTCSVTPGAIDRTVSTVTVSSSSRPAGGAAATVTLQAKDAAGNKLTTGGSIVAFDHAGGTCVISIGSVTDHSDGTYTAQITPTTEGTATTLSATIGGQAVTTTMPTFTVTAASTALVFASAWGTGTGQGDSAVTDGGKWTGVNEGSRLQVVNAAGDGLANWPSTNALRIQAQGTPAFGLERFGAGSGWTTPAIGETRYFRLYHWSDIAAEQSGHSDHPLGYMFSGMPQPDRMLDWQFQNRDQDPFTLLCETPYTQQPADYTAGLGHHYVIQLLHRSTTYRWEWALTRLSAEGFHLDIRIYDGSGTLVASNHDFTCNFGHAFHHLDDYDPNMNVDSASLSNVDGLASFYIDDQGGHNYTGYHYYGAFAVSSVNWCGPYVP